MCLQFMHGAEPARPDSERAGVRLHKRVKGGVLYTETLSRLFGGGLFSWQEQLAFAGGDDMRSEVQKPKMVHRPLGVTLGLGEGIAVKQGFLFCMCYFSKQYTN